MERKRTTSVPELIYPGMEGTFYICILARLILTSESRRVHIHFIDHQGHFCDTFSFMFLGSSQTFSPAEMRFIFGPALSFPATNLILRTA